MKKIALFLLFCMSAHASCYFDNTNFYAKFLGGVNFLQETTLDGNQTTYDPGYILSPSIGYCWNYGISLEAEYAYRRNAIDKINFVQEGSSTDGHFLSSSFMANLLWKLPFCYWNIRPFVGSGIGYDFQKMHAINPRVIFDQKWHHFSWQLMAGLAYPIFRDTEITLEYKFHQGGHHFYSHSLGVGLLYNFGYIY